MEPTEIYNQYGTSIDEITEARESRRPIKEIERTVLGFRNPADLLAHIEGNAMQYRKSVEGSEDPLVADRILKMVEYLRESLDISE